MWQLTPVCNSSFRGRDTLFWSVGMRHTGGADTQAKHPNTHSNFKKPKLICITLEFLHHVPNGTSGKTKREKLKLLLGGTVTMSVWSTMKVTVPGHWQTGHQDGCRPNIKLEDSILSILPMSVCFIPHIPKKSGGIRWAGTLACPWGTKSPLSAMKVRPTAPITGS